MTAQRRRAQGFSLMELMIVVAITGILAAIAIPTFITYVQKSRTSEATQFLGVIKLKQEAHRAEFGGYLVCNNKRAMSDIDAASDLYKPGNASTMKNSVALVLSDPCFSDLGAAPDGPVRFGYAWAAGTPTDLSGVGSGVATALGLTAADFDHYFVAHAITDLDGDAVPVIFELSNFTKNIYIMNSDGTPSASGFE